jgi:lipoprotein-anchoring transpeptidase ErfK/SrfK
MSRRLRVCLVGALTLGLMVAAATPALAAQTAAAPGTYQQLSNETTFTRYAYIDRVADIFTKPTTHSRVVAKLQWYTESNFPEPYVELQSYTNAKHGVWIEVRIPGRPNGRTGWVERNTLNRAHMTHQEVVVNRSKLRLYFYEAGRLVWSTPVAVGKPSTPTPPGHFWVTEKFTITDPASGYYPYAYGTSDYSTLTEWPEGGVVGIHGPYYQPNLIPGRISHRCIRLKVAADRWLGHHLRIGAPVLIT